MGMFGNAMGAMVGQGGGNAGPMQRRPGMPVQGQNPGMMGQNQNAMSGARTAQMRNPMNPGMGMGPSMGMQQKMMPQSFPGQQMGSLMGQMKGGMGNYNPPPGGMVNDDPSQFQRRRMHDMGPDHIPGRGGMERMPQSLDQNQMLQMQEGIKQRMGGNTGINGGNMGKYAPMIRGQMGGPPMQGPDMGGGMQEAPEEVPGAEEMANPQMQNLMSQYGNRGPMNSPMQDPRMRNFGGPRGMM